jgi:phosphomannomutase / phosphoglucomutase
LTIQNLSPVIAISRVPLAAFALAFIVAILLSMFVVQSSLNAAYRQQMIDSAADVLQLRINLQQQALLAQTQALGNSIRLSELLADADTAALAREENRIRETIPNALQVRLIRRGEAKVDRDSEPPFTFASLDLAKRTEAGEPTYPEAIQYKDRWLLSIAAPVKRPAEAASAGTLFIYVEMNAISNSLDGQIAGGLALLQTFDRSPTSTVLSLGTTGSAAVVARPLANPYWQINFYPDNTLTDAAPAGLLLYLLPALAGLGIALAGTLACLAQLPRHRTLGAMPRQAMPRQAVPRQAEPAQVAPVAGTQPSTPDISGKSTFVTAAQDQDWPAADEEITAPTDLGSIFRAYDIRGVVGATLTPNVIYKIGLAIGSEAIQLGQQALLVGADGRLSSPDVMASLINGILATGMDVIRLGAVPTPVLYFATHTTETTSGVMITGSHNPPQYNGFKIVFRGKTLVDADIQRLYRRFVAEDFNSGRGELRELDILDQYFDAISDDVVVAQPLRVVVDCGNGIAGDITPDIYMNLGCEVIPLYCDVDGNFPNHHPDPTIASNLQDLILMVKSQGADLGLALDGDGDRLVAVTGSGEIIAPDQLLMLFAKDVVFRNPGSDVVYDIKCTRHLNSVISGFGGRPIICRSGHSYLKEKMAETDAALGGEFSGHVCFNERWYGFDDGIYAGARLLEIVGSQTAGLDELMREFPQSVSTPELKLAVDELEKFRIIDLLLEHGDFSAGAVSTLDGIRVDFADGWGLVRASNTGPCLTLRFEADDQTGLERIESLFRQQLHKVDQKLDF